MNQVSNCQSCAYFETKKNGAATSSLGLCRINPPSSVINSEPLGVWPTVRTNDWFGKYSN